MKTWIAIALIALFALTLSAQAAPQPSAAKGATASRSLINSSGFCTYNCYNASTGTSQHFGQIGPMSQSACCGETGWSCPSGTTPVGIVAWAPLGGHLSICSIN